MWTTRSFFLLVCVCLGKFENFPNKKVRFFQSSLKIVERRMEKIIFILREAFSVCFSKVFPWSSPHLKESFRKIPRKLTNFVHGNRFKTRNSIRH